LLLFFQNRAVHTAALALALVIALLAGALGTAAAQQALPGERLYPIKTFGEAMRLAFTRDPANQARLHFEFARRRMAEVDALAQAGQYQTASIALEDFNLQVSQAASLLRAIRVTQTSEAQALAASLDQWLADQVDDIARLCAS
jgi:hypothetical protein